MIDRGVNPYVIDYSGESEFVFEKLSSLSNLPTSKSIFFSIQSFECFCDHKCGSDLSTPWFYKNGVFDGQFDRILGKGASGVVLHGFCHGFEAAFKFVEVEQQEFKEYAEDALDELNRKLGEMRSVQTTAGSKIVNFYGHFR